MNALYYRIYLNRDNKYVPVCMQDFDERDYDQSRFLVENKFPSELAALEFIARTRLLGLKLSHGF